jgi:hypothetical protein
MSNENSDERRHFHRILFDAPLLFTTMGDGYDSSLIDISLNGALIHRPDGWNGKSGDGATISIHLGESEDEEIIMEGTVTHVDENGLGLRCTHIDMNSITHLRRLLELNLGDMEVLERDMEALG